MAYQILALSGGGFLGLYTACVLAELERSSGTPLHEQFDLIAGTSIGGIIALGLAAGTPAAAIRDAMIEAGPRIFRATPPPQTGAGRVLALAGSALRAGYRPQPLRAAIERIVGRGRRVGDLRQRTIVPTVNLTKGGPQIFKTSHHETFVRDWRLEVADVALATSAAPTFFPLHRIGGELFADGALYANAPDHLALHEAEHFLGWRAADVAMLSLGTTTSQFSFSNTVGADMGWVGWMAGQRLPNVMIASQQIVAQEMLRHRLGGRYRRIDQKQSPQQERFLGLDVASPGAMLDLRGLAEASAREHLATPGLRRMLDHRAPPPTFFHA